MIKKFKLFEARRNINQYVGCELECEIINKIGKNKTNEKFFTKDIFINKYSLLGFYTHRGQLCILDGEGMDVNFNTYSDIEKTLIHKAIMNNEYE